MTGHVNCMLLLSFVLSSAQAAELPDPTRPPYGIGYENGASGGAQEEGYEPRGAQPAKRGLRSVIIAPSRRAAIIDGQTVELGGKYQDAELVEVSEDGIVLQGRQGRQKLLLMFPGVGVTKKGKQPVIPATQPADHRRMGQPEYFGDPQEEK